MPIISVKRHLTGDLSLPKGTPLAHRRRWNRLLRKLAKAARSCNQRWNVNSGYRSYAEQKALYERNMANGRRRPGRPLTARPGTSNHEGGKAADVNISGIPVGASHFRRAALERAGLCLPVPGELWHVEEGDVWRAARDPDPKD